MYEDESGIRFDEHQVRVAVAAVAGFFAARAGQPRWLVTSAMLANAFEQGATAPLMLLGTARPEFRAPWPTRAHHSQLTLNRLSEGADPQDGGAGVIEIRVVVAGSVAWPDDYRADDEQFDSGGAQNRGQAPCRVSAS